MLTAAACGGGVADKAEEFADKICACEDAACLEKVMEEYKDLDDVKESDLGEADRKKLEAAGDRVRECVTKISAGAGAE